MKPVLIGLFGWAASLWSAVAPAETFVLMYGAWSGGWAFQPVAEHLQNNGHAVSRPTLSGLGERVHLQGPVHGLETHIQDVIHHIEFERLHDIVLVGHSHGGMVISGVADRIPERITRLVYVEGLVPDDGESLRDIHAPAAATFDALKRGEVLTHPAYRPDAPFPQPVPQRGQPETLARWLMAVPAEDQRTADE